jgi:photosystem II stability/assembly factor-like uncharacterized protein
LLPFGVHLGPKFLELEEADMAIALSHGGPTVYASETSADEVLVGTARGIARMARDGANWRVVGHMLEDKHISAILIEPRSGAIFAGAYKDGSLHVSLDGGETWQRRDSGLAETDVYSLEAAEIDGRVRLFCGTEPARLFFSDDLGETWAEMPELRSVPTVDSWSFPGPPHVAHAKHITFDPRDPQTMYVSIEVGGLLRSRDGGKTFEDVPGMYEDVHRLVINPADPRRMYVPGGNGLYLSQDEGQSWQHVLTREHEVGGYPDQLVLHPQDPDLMFIAAAQDSPGAWRTTRFAGARISRSHDGGRTWQVLGGGLPDRMQGNVEAMSLHARPEGCSLFAATTAGEVFVSEDSGDSWTLAVTDLAPISKGGHYVPLMPVGSTAG